MSTHVARSIVKMKSETQWVYERAQHSAFLTSSVGMAMPLGSTFEDEFITHRNFSARTWHAVGTLSMFFFLCYSIIPSSTLPYLACF